MVKNYYVEREKNFHNVEEGYCYNILVFIDFEKTILFKEIHIFVTQTEKNALNYEKLSENIGI